MDDATFHQAAVVRKHHHLVRCDVFPDADVAHDFAREIVAFVPIGLPVDDVSAEDIEEQVQVDVASHHQRGQICDVPDELPNCRTAELPIERGGRQGAELCNLGWWALGTAVG